MIICDTCHQTIDFMKDDDELILHFIDEAIKLAGDASKLEIDKYAQVVEILVEARYSFERS